MKNNSLLLTDTKNIFYVTKAPFEGFWLLMHNNRFIVITSRMIYGQVKQYFKNNTEIFVIKTSFSDELIEICKKYKITTLSIDTANINYSLFKLLNNKLKTNKISVCEDNNTIIEKRKIKNKQEIKDIKKACDIVSEVFETVKRKVVPGMTELDIHFKIEEEFAKRHVVQSFKTIVASGPNSANPHHISGNRKIQKNDIVLTDMGCIYNGYCSDLTRTFFVGKEDKNKRKVWNIVKQAHDKALINVKENMKASDTDLFARNIIKQEGYDKNFIHTTGHGVGLDIHEAPVIGSKSKDILKEGMIITIEPGIYLEKKFGVRIEDTVLVTKNGYKVLTTAKY
ncbi:MAG: aminopeptidase P family protein [Endomicrobiaceae bacterium]|nr:aminopeptidase P family protein [Endomicrobiaceae bacterium]